jgi:hypothetical protein
VNAHVWLRRLIRKCHERDERNTGRNGQTYDDAKPPHRMPSKWQDCEP